MSIVSFQRKDKNYIIFLKVIGCKISFNTEYPVLFTLVTCPYKNGFNFGRNS